MRVFILILIICTVYGAIENEQFRYNKCFSKCQSTFEINEAACLRGCRFHMMEYIQSYRPFMDIAVANTPVIERCESDCDEAYPKAGDDSFACGAGCEMANFGLEESNAEVAETESKSHTFEPLYQIKEIASKAFGLVQMVRSTMTTFFRSDDGQIVAIRGPTRLSFELLQEPENQSEPVSNDLEAQSSQRIQLSDGVTAEQIHDVELSVMPMVFWSTMVMACLGFLIMIVVIMGKRMNRNSLVLISKIPKGSLFPPKTIAPPPQKNIIPVKLVRPEDLTKLSILDDEDFNGPTKIDLPNKRV